MIVLSCNPLKHVWRSTRPINRYDSISHYEHYVQIKKVQPDYYVLFVNCLVYPVIPRSTSQKQKPVQRKMINIYMPSKKIILKNFYTVHITHKKAKTTIFILYILSFIIYHQQNSLQTE